MDYSAKLLLFYVSENKYALDISKVEKVIQVVEITPLLNKLDYIRGVINMKGIIVPVIDIKQLLKKYSSEDEKVNIYDKIIIVRFEGKHIGLLVDEIAEVIDNSKESHQFGNINKDDSLGSSACAEELITYNNEIVQVFDVCKLGLLVRGYGE